MPMQRSLLDVIIADQLAELKGLERYVQRDEFFELDRYFGAAALVVKGVRRCGKSTLMMQLMLKKFAGNFLYFNFDDERLSGFRAKDFQMLMETLIAASGDKKHIFFDEIQNISGWELFVNRLLRQGYRVFITGSNANLLSKELGTHLTGRHIDLELYPFSFAEFIKAKKIPLLRTGSYSTAQRALVLNAFKEYLKVGGMPEAVVFSNEAILTQVVNDIIQRDILSRYSVRKPAELKAVIKFLIANAANMITYRSIVENFRIKSPNTVQKYVDYATEAYLLFEVKRYERKIRRFDKNQKKIYCIDSGIITKNSPVINDRGSAILENTIAVQLKRSGLEFYYYRNNDGWESDFVIPSQKSAIQVCYDLNSSNSQREFRGLVHAVKDTGAKKAMVLTLDQEQEIVYQGVRIEVKPAWKWLLEFEARG